MQGSNPEPKEFKNSKALVIEYYTQNPNLGPIASRVPTGLQNNVSII